MTSGSDKIKEMTFGSDAASEDEEFEKVSKMEAISSRRFASASFQSKKEWVKTTCIFRRRRTGKGKNLSKSDLLRRKQEWVKTTCFRG